MTYSTLAYQPNNTKPLANTTNLMYILWQDECQLQPPSQLASLTNKRIWWIQHPYYKDQNATSVSRTHSWQACRNLTLVAFHILACLLPFRAYLHPYLAFQQLEVQVALEAAAERTCSVIKKVALVRTHKAAKTRWIKDKKQESYRLSNYFLLFLLFRLLLLICF